VNSKQRVAEHGEVFTSVWMVEAMLDLLNAETGRIDSRVLEPAWELPRAGAPLERNPGNVGPMSFGGQRSLHSEAGEE
jgi:hypothetical protein